MPGGEAQEGREKPGRGLRSWLLLDIKKRNIALHHFYPARAGEFCGAAAMELPVPDFPCFVFAAVVKYTCKHVYLTCCPRKKVHGKPGQAIPLPPPRKIFPSVRPSKHNISD